MAKIQQQRREDLEVPRGGHFFYLCHSRDPSRNSEPRRKAGIFFSGSRIPRITVQGIRDDILF